MNRVELVRQAVDDVVRQQPDEEESRCGFVHLYGVALTCVLLALRRGLNPELRTVAGMLHDIWTYKTGDPKDHARPSAVEAKKMMLELGCFTQEEMDAIGQAIANHSSKDETHGALDELLKDADVLQHYLYNTSLLPRERTNVRIDKILEELGLTILETDFTTSQGRAL